MPENTVELGSELTIRNIQPIYSQLAELLHQGRPVTLNASRLIKADTAGLQLLLCLQSHCTNCSIPLNWKGITTELVAQFKQMGMQLPGITDQA
ncbi:STAS domain-containing protein [Shewanella litorisediminis]|uniref:STAS domain-containing protein n=1 Tax=Shewanella litorisediminis TaxID=1173586 RepID=A0ABX7G306_9GAMM|nr:STAS domain-containing protein [Shewanella litorisediminis]MCL2917231.1 STAS domain-containing protein [Shewanella litorisediminis]QRH01705.1 STAS domain-containing protein [Shewanella litorisediminis]